MFGRELLWRGATKNICNGHDTSVWTDKWLMDEYPRRPINKDIFMDLNIKVSHLVNENGVWNKPRLEELFPTDDVRQVIDISISNGCKDSWM